MDKLNELYRQKGELATQADIISAKLNAVNGEIVKILNAQADGSQQEVNKEDED